MNSLTSIFSFVQKKRESPYFICIFVTNLLKERKKTNDKMEKRKDAEWGHPSLGTIFHNVAQSPDDPTLISSEPHMHRRFPQSYIGNTSQTRSHTVNLAVAW